jgi:putative transcriptional regulator
MSSLQGKFLVASPHLGDGNFFRSVVLMIKHDADGAFGLILNRPLNNTLAEIWQAIDEESGGEMHSAELDLEAPLVGDQPIYVGGPVQGPLVVVHGAKKAWSEAQIMPGVHFAAHKDHLKKVITQTKKPFRVFSGYSGWGAGQLEGELQAGGWLIADADKETIFYTGDDLWERIVQLIAEQILNPGQRTKHVPPDPSLN